MCDFATAAAVMAIGQAGSAVYNFAEGTIAANAQGDFAAKRAQAVAEATRDDLVSRYSSLAKRGVEERKAASMQIAQISRAAMAARGEIAATSGAAGVEGTSVDSVLRDFEYQESIRIEAVESDLASTEENLKMQGESYAAEGKNRIEANISGPIARPSLFGALIQVGGAFLGYKLAMGIQGGGLAGTTSAGTTSAGSAGTVSSGGFQGFDSAGFGGYL